MKTSRFVKTALFIALGMWILLPSAFTQPRLGIIGGMNFSDLREDGVENSMMDYSTRSGFKAGLVAELGIGNSGFALQAEPMYVEKGALMKLESSTFRAEADELESDFRMTYIELPILAKYSFGLGVIRPFVVAGPEFGWMMNAKVNGTDVKEDLREFDVLATAGLGLDIELMETAYLFLEGRYNYGFSDLNDVEESTTELYNRGVQVMGGVKLALW